MPGCEKGDHQRDPRLNCEMCRVVMLLDSLSEVVGRLVIEVGTGLNPQVVSDWDMTTIQEAAERAVRAAFRENGGDGDGE